MAESNAAENQIRRLRKEALIEHVHALRRMLIIITATIAVVFAAMFYQMSSLVFCCARWLPAALM